MSEDIDKIRSYAERIFDGDFSKADLKSLETLIVSDQRNLQAYVELMNLHGALVFEAECSTDEQAVVAAFQVDSPAARQANRRTSWRYWWAATACIAAVLCVGAFVHFGANRPQPMGSIVHLTNDALSGFDNLGLGRTIFKAGTIEIQQGVVSLQLDQVLLDLIGPVRLKMDSKDRVHLLEGSLVAHVLPGGEGFTVETPDTKVVDLGTQFSVEYSTSTGTNVSVRKGRARVNLLNEHRAPTQVLDLTSHRSAQCDSRNGAITEVEYTPRRFQQVNRARGTILSTSGQIRTNGEPPPDLSSTAVQTRNHILVIPEQQDLKLVSYLEVQTHRGITRIPAGTVISSYLIHYDPVDSGSLAPRAAVTFMGQVLGMIVDGNALKATDALCGLPGTIYEAGSFRGLEMDADQINLSDDGRTVSCFFGMAPPSYLDQARIIVLGDGP